MSTYNQVTMHGGHSETNDIPEDGDHSASTPDPSKHWSSDETVRDHDALPEKQKSVKQEESESLEKPAEIDHDKTRNGERDGNDDEENQKQQGPPLPVGLRDSSLHKVRLEVFFGWLRTTLMLATFILTVLSLYWAVFYTVEDNIGSLTIAVVNFDGRVPPYTQSNGLVGQTVVQAALKQAQIPKGIIGYRIRDPTQFNNDPMAVRQWVYDQHDWAAIIVNANASTLLEQAVGQGNQSYDPLGAMQMIYVEARDQDAYSSYILPQLTEFSINVQAQFGQKWVQRVLNNDSLSPTTYSNSPQALSPAIGTSIFNLRPFGPPQVTPAVSIGLIYLIILSFFNFGFYLPIYSKFLIPQEHPPMHFYEQCATRLFGSMSAYFLLSLAYSLVSLAFQVPFSNTGPHPDTSVVSNPDAFGKGSFVVYWMLNFVGMYALGLASENVTMIVGQPWTALWLIFWVITNVSTSFYPLPLEAAFFRWGYAWPLHQVVEASRTILFATHSRLGLNFGILFTWCAINTVVFFPACLYMRWKNNKEMARKAPRSTLRYLIDG